MQGDTANERSKTVAQELAHLREMETDLANWRRQASIQRHSIQRLQARHPADEREID
jgi:hypothetical protein